MRRIFLTLFACITLSQRCLAEQPALSPVPSLEEVTAKVAASEQTIKNLAIHGFVGRLQTAATETGEWKDTGETVSGDAWYNGLLGSKARINCKTTNLSEDPNGPITEWEQEVSWNGKTGREVHERWGLPGRAADIHSANVTPTPPPLLSADGIQRYLDGSGLCLNFYRAGTSGYSLSVRLQRARDIHVPVSLKWDSVFGARTIRIEIGNDPLRCNAWWLDADHNYALRRSEAWYKTQPAGPRLNLLINEVEQLSDAGGGIWVPTRGARTEQFRPGYRRFKFESKRVIANDSAFDESIFTVPIPPRYLVADATTGKTFYTSDAQDTTQAIEQAVKELHAQ